MVKKLLLFIVLLFSSILNAQTLYWVGGSGNFNDANHWSLTSGGTTSGISPSASTDLIFDNNSSYNDLVINITGINHVKSLVTTNSVNQYHFVGSNLSTIYFGGNFSLSNKTYFETASKLVFSSAGMAYNQVDVSINILKADVVFENGNWDLVSVKVADNNLLKFNKGNYKITNASITVYL